MMSPLKLLDMQKCLTAYGHAYFLKGYIHTSKPQETINYHCYSCLCDCFMCLIFVLHSWFISSFPTYLPIFVSTLQGIYSRGGHRSGSVNASVPVKDIWHASDFERVKHWFRAPSLMSQNCTFKTQLVSDQCNLEEFTEAVRSEKSM